MGLDIPRPLHTDDTLMQQSYLPKSYCWDRRSVQAAASLRSEMCSFLAAHPKLKAFSGLRADEASGDHRCGFALDLVPVDGATAAGFAAVERGYADAITRGYPYVEPLALTWKPGNHHLHISFKRCPKSTVQGNE